MPAEEPIAAALKLDFLMRHPVPRAVLGHDATMVSLARKLDISRKTLIGQRDKGAFTSYVQSQLAQKFDFGLDWQEWLTGTVEHFKERYCRAHGSSGQPLPASRQYDPAVQLRLERLAQVEPPAVDAIALASITLFLQQSGAGREPAR